MTSENESCTHVVRLISRVTRFLLAEPCSTLVLLHAIILNVYRNAARKLTGLVAKLLGASVF